uniref:Uncharacterized protein n=1 Tax=Panagrolaimus sp. JU765 TaxID=591449 RepID=A0AC34RJX8_9BILA
MAYYCYWYPIEEFEVTDKYTKWSGECAISGVFKIKCLNGQNVSTDAKYELWEYDDDQHSDYVNSGHARYWGKGYVEADILVEPKNYNITEPRERDREFMEFFWKWTNVCEKGKTIIIPNVKSTYFEI